MAIRISVRMIPLVLSSIFVVFVRNISSVNAARPILTDARPTNPLKRKRGDSSTIITGAGGSIISIDETKSAESRFPYNCEASLPLIVRAGRDCLTTNAEGFKIPLTPDEIKTLKTDENTVNFAVKSAKSPSHQIFTPVTSPAYPSGRLFDKCTECLKPRFRSNSILVDIGTVLQNTDELSRKDGFSTPRPLGDGVCSCDLLNRKFKSK